MTTKMSKKHISKSRIEILKKKGKEVCSACGTVIPRYYINCPECGKPKRERE